MSVVSTIAIVALGVTAVAEAAIVRTMGRTITRLDREATETARNDFRMRLALTGDGDGDAEYRIVDIGAGCVSVMRSRQWTDTDGEEHPAITRIKTYRDSDRDYNMLRAQGLIDKLTETDR